MSVIIVGTPIMEEWEAKDGTKRSKLKINADHIGLSLNRYSAKATKTTNSGSAPQVIESDPWATNQTDDVPF
jgi:single-stranded DNA-binding protein